MTIDPTFFDAAQLVREGRSYRDVRRYLISRTTYEQRNRMLAALFPTTEAVAA